MLRWGSLALRLSLIGAGSLLLVIAIAGAVLYAQRVGDVRSRVSAPVPDQIVAVVELLEKTPQSDLPLVLRALNSSTLRVRVATAEPAWTKDAVALPGVDWIVARYLDALGGREVRVRMDPGRDSAAEPLRPLRIDVRLRDGRWATAEVRGELVGRAFGVPAAVAALLLTLAVGAASLWAIRREVRPIEQLAGAAERFGSLLDATPVKARGSREVRGLIDAFNRMQDRIRTLIDGRTRLLAAISHDVGTYLTRLRLRAEFIGDEDQRSRAVRDIGAMQDLLTDSLALARLEGDEAPGESDLAAVARAQVQAFAAEGADVRAHIEEEAVGVRGREVALARLVANLISNAVKYGGSAEVSLRIADGFAELLVEDRGPGIPASEREQVLEPFFRREAARNLDVPGSGLGLAIANDIVRRIGGSLSLGDREGGGLTVRARLPVIVSMCAYH